jgi:hypothetical protein
VEIIDKQVKAYILKDPEEVEHCMVIKTKDVELLYSLVRRMGRMRDERLKSIGRALEERLNE